jgi:hypothetical protein
MPQYPNRQFLDFEQPIKELYEHIEENKKLAEKNSKIDYSQTIQQLEVSIEEKLSALVEHTKLYEELLGDIKSFAIMKKQGSCCREMNCILSNS